MNQHSARRCERRTAHNRSIAHHARETLHSVRTRIDYLAESVTTDATPLDIGTQRRMLWNVSRDTLAVIKDLDDLREIFATLEALCTCSALVAEQARQQAREQKTRGAAALAFDAHNLAVSLHRLQARTWYRAGHAAGSGDAA